MFSVKGSNKNAMGLKHNFTSALLILCAIQENTMFAQNRVTQGEKVNRGGISIITPMHSPQSLRELLELSKLVVLATCESEAPSRFLVKTDVTSDIVTDRIMRIKETLQGTAPSGGRIAVQELGGQLNTKDGSNAKQIIHGQLPIRQGETYLLFLRPRSESVGDEFDSRRYSITGVWAGSFHLANGRVQISKEVQLGLRQHDNSLQDDLLNQVRLEISRLAK
jgi:hypothetical protein